MPNPRLFISYSHQPPEHAEQVRAFIAATDSDPIDLHHDGALTLPQGPPEGWITWMRDQIDQADWILVTCNAPYLDSWNKDQKAGRGVAYEAAIIRQMLYDDRMVNRKLVPVYFASPDRDQIPTELRDATAYHLPDQWPTLLGRILKSTWLGRFIDGMGTPPHGASPTATPSLSSSTVTSSAEEFDHLADTLPAVANLQQILISEANQFVLDMASASSELDRERIRVAFRRSFCSKVRLLVELGVPVPRAIEALFESQCAT